MKIWIIRLILLVNEVIDFHNPSLKIFQELEKKGLKRQAIESPFLWRCLTLMIAEDDKGGIFECSNSEVSRSSTKSMSTAQEQATVFSHFTSLT